MRRNKKRVYFLIIILVLLINDLVYSQRTEKQGEEFITPAGYKIKILILGYQDPFEKYSIEEGIKNAFDAAASKGLSCLPVSKDGKSCVRAAFKNMLKNKVLRIQFTVLPEGYYGRGYAEIGGDYINIWNHDTEFWWGVDEEGRETRYPFESALFHEMLHTAGYDEDIAVGCKAKLKIKNSKLKISKG